MRMIAAVILLLAVGAASALADERQSGRLENIDIFELEYAADPQISPDGTHVAYVRRTNDIMTDRARSNIWIAAADGSDHRPLLSGKSNFSSPRWSPDGGRLAYVSAVEGGKPQLFVRWMDTGQTALVTNLTEAPGSLAWSPDGRALAFTMHVADAPEPMASAPAKPEGAQWAPPAIVIEEVIYRFDGKGYLDPGHRHVFTAPADGGSPRQLTSGDFNHDGPLSWTPDGEALLFSANRDEDWARNPTERDVWRVSVADKEMTRLTTRKGPDRGARVSPDGARVAYLGFDDKRMGHHNTHLYVMNADGSDKKALTGALDRSIEDAAWAGDDALIVRYDQRGHTYLATVTLDGEATPLVRDVGGTTLGRPYTSGDFSVNAKGDVAYTTARATRPADVAVRLAGGEATRVTQLNDDLFQDKTLAPIERITWPSSADGREIEGWLATPPRAHPAAGRRRCRWRSCGCWRGICSGRAAPI